MIGTGTRFEFTAGLNVVSGPISTGKTTLLRMARAIFGTGIERFPREPAQTVTALAARLQIGESQYVVLRPFVSTTTAKVEIASDKGAWRLPALELDGTAEATYGQWLLEHLGLPRLEVPSAPTRPESSPSPVSINDYFLYCSLPQDEIDSAVFGSRDSFKDIKRRYVFQILYGLYDVETAQLLERLRALQTRLTALSNMQANLESLLGGTPWANRATLEHDLRNAEAQLRVAEHETVESAAAAATVPEIQQLRAQVLAMDSSLAELRDRIEKEKAANSQLHDLAGQLEVQSSRLTRAIVAGDLLVDFEFMLCPRCGTPLPHDRGSVPGLCLLCLQIPNPELSKADLVREQDRIASQIAETRQLIDNHLSLALDMERRQSEIAKLRRDKAAELERLQATFVSDSASAIARRAADHARLREVQTRLKDYLTLYSKADQVAIEAQQLEAARRSVMARLETAKSRVSDAEARIRHLELRFEELLEQFKVPRFTDKPAVGISRQTFMPIVDGRRFDELSSQGLKVLVNVAHALAHHLTAIDLGLPMPGILLIDGLTSNLGHEDEDIERVRGVYQYLISLSETHGDQLQLIVADHDVPDYARPFIRIRFTEDERLIPASALHQ